MAPRDAIWIGIQPHGAGWRAVVSRGRGRTALMRHFAKDTDPREMQAWRHDTRAALRLKRKQRAFGGSFEHDARKYLRSVAALPTFTQRVKDIERWIAVFGTKTRHDIEPSEIRAMRDQWMIEPRSLADPRPLAPGTINKRLRALSNLWTVLDGARAPNPVRDVPEVQEPAARPRAIPYELIEQIIAHMPDVGRGAKHKKRPVGSKSRARCRVLAYTGWPPGVLAKMRPDDVNLTSGIAALPDRRKGRGAGSILVPLLPQAVTALQEFDRLKCWGRFSQSSLRKSWKAAAAKVGLLGVRVYDLRASMATGLGRASGDERAVQHLLQHQNISTTRRYTLSSIPERAQLAVDQFAGLLKKSE